MEGRCNPGAGGCGVVALWLVCKPSCVAFDDGTLAESSLYYSTYLPT